VAGGAAGGTAGGAAGGAGGGYGRAGGVMTLLDQVQVMSMVGRVQGPGSGEGTAEFSKGFQWVHMIT